ncbi:MAG: response regulator transcription factor [Clostridiales bacterium]|nr:response regulator transcription factor [Clostridiales bacterium]
MAKKVLIVDDDADIIELQKLYFEKEGYEVVSCMQGDKAVATFNVTKPDIIILDLMLPGMDGNDICREIRRVSDVPIIMLTARTDTLDRVVGLELGADDYVPKPFEPKELLARVKAVLRRTEKSAAGQGGDAAGADENKATDLVTFPGLTIDKVKYVVTADGKEVYMPPKELELLFFLASNPNRVYSREQLLENVWGYDFFGESRTVDVHIKRIREKIEIPGVERDWCIRTVWSRGYKFETK